MNLGQITSLIKCQNCGLNIEIYPSQESIKCECGFVNNLKMRDLTLEEEKAVSKGLLEISEPTGYKLF